MDTIPGADTLGFGFDVTKRYHESSTTEQIFKEGTPDARTMTLGTTTYSVPQNIGTEPLKKSEGSSRVFSTRQQVQDHFSGKAGITGSGFGFKGHFDMSYSHLAKSDKSYYYALVEATEQSYNLKLKEQGESWLTPQFAGDLAKLPDSYTAATQKKFFTFFSKYGTHYVHQVKLGGSLYYYVAIEKSTTLDESKVQTNLDLEYKGLFGKVKADASAAWEKVDKTWANSRTVSLSTQGGDNELDGLAPSYKEWKGEGFSKWSNSLINKPGLAGFNLRPISALVSTTDENKSDAVKAALVDYLKGGLIVRADRDFNPQSANEQYIAYPTIEGPEGIVRPPTPAPPKTDRDICGMQIVLFDPKTCKSISNKVYYGTVATVPKMYADAVADIRRVPQSDYFTAVSIFGVSPVQYPSPELAGWLSECGANLTAWHKYIGATTIANGIVCYTLAGRKGGSLNAKEEFTIDPTREVKKVNSTSLLFIREQGLRR